VTELDDAAAELRAARAELRAELLLAAEWARMNAPEDPVAALITESASRNSGHRARRRDMVMIMAM
jgi:hypothetical protein